MALPLPDNIKAEISVKLDGKRSEKFIDVIKDWVGIGFSLNKKKKINDADADAYRIVTIARAEKEAELIKDDPELVSRTYSRIEATEVKRQKNIESVIAKTPKILGSISQENTSGATVSEEWRARFFDKAANVSKDDLQEIWAQILARKIAEPDSISIRTLEVLSNLESSEAELFQTLCSISLDPGIVLCRDDNNLKKGGLEFRELHQLMDAGLVAESALTMILNYSGELDGWAYDNDAPIIFGDKKFKINALKEPKTNTIYLSGYVLSNAGREIRRIVEFVPNYDYFFYEIGGLGDYFEVVEIT